MDGSGKTLYVAEIPANSIASIDTDALQISGKTSSIANVAYDPSSVLQKAMTLLPDGSRLYLADNTSGIVAIIHTRVRPNVIVDRISGLTDPAGITTAMHGDKVMPARKEDSKNGKWKNHGFRNQGQCIASIVVPRNQASHFKTVCQPVKKSETAFISPLSMQAS